ncbi:MULTISPECIES: hypothetical protein [Paraburkholderia]|jgi:hypothetical protein|uniref:Uncharacterized protein n=1 Tax=Paraburkholderia tropica TaxID=92647 RepID=A0A1A5XGD5_9BURK|nr:MULTISPECIES: hypothetical protein [Paraburkholderia]MBB2982773.1 hypothetical protein [Paraburkholderia tropica]MBB3003178.1 hypothetical protein [Paraburkholderia tropica]MBB6322195.1 hypothetical protein [Paraburkholderia tropica]MDE1143356.1 hypothetical protein [Paraburkholderia tropica]OBR52477.1 hypothetical protein A6456_16410 [Paraburkholderia tropica]
MRALRVEPEAGKETVERRMVDFQAAVKAIAARVGATDINAAGTPISAFKTNYSSVLKRVKSGSVEIVNQGQEPFIILGLDQAVALMSNTVSDRTVAEVFAGLPSVPATGKLPRDVSIDAEDHYRVPR